MPTRFTHLVVDSVEIAPIARFWSELLGWPVLLDEDDEIYIADDYLGIVFVPVPESKTVKNRVHVDLASDSPEQQRKIVAKALSLGARHIDIGQGDVPWAVMADPDGNEFCVVDKSPEGVDTGAVLGISMDCADPRAIAPLWSAATGMPVYQGDRDFVGLRPAGGRGVWLAMGRVPEAKTVKNRVHLDVRPFAGDDQAAEVKRLIGLGAQHADVGQGPDVSWVVLADDEGNEFCVLSPRD
jgi:hypothetical protein